MQKFASNLPCNELRTFDFDRQNFLTQQQKLMGSLHFATQVDISLHFSLSGKSRKILNLREQNTAQSRMNAQFTRGLLIRLS